MFTGLIEAVGEVVEVQRNDSGFRLRLQTTLAPELHTGDSLAVNGVCLTVVDATANRVDADVGPETARVTTLATLRSGQPANLERSMRSDGRFGGHFVQGHVDGTGEVAAIRDDGESHWLRLRLPAGAAPFPV